MRMYISAENKIEYVIYIFLVLQSTELTFASSTSEQ
jgi:hypothetical protein